MVVTSSRAAGLLFYEALKEKFIKRKLPYKILYVFSDFADENGGYKIIVGNSSVFIFILCNYYAQPYKIDYFNNREEFASAARKKYINLEDMSVNWHNIYMSKLKSKLKDIEALLKSENKYEEIEKHYWNSDIPLELDNQDKEIKINSRSYPVTIKAEGISLKLKDMVTGKLMDKTISDGESFVLQRDLGALNVETIEKPITYKLEQNYPNPFNPSTTIKFSVPENTMVELSIYNVLGEKVLTLVNGEMEAGYYQADWNAGNMSSGIYFYKITTNKYTSFKKLMLMK